MARHRGLFPSPPPGSAILVHYFVFSKVVPSRYTRNQSRNHDRKPTPVENDKVKSSGRLLLALDLFLLSSLPSLKNRPLAIFSAASLNRGTKESEMWLRMGEIRVLQVAMLQLAHSSVVSADVVCWSNESREDNAINFKTRAAPTKGKGGTKERRRSPRYPRGLAQRLGHVCIIRDKPITARNACQAVKRYPGQQPGGLMISLGNLLRFPSSSLLSRLPRPFTAHYHRAHCCTHHYHHYHYYYYPAYNFIPLPIREDLIITSDDDRRDYESFVPEYISYSLILDPSIRILCGGRCDCDKLIEMEIGEYIQRVINTSYVNNLWASFFFFCSSHRSIIDLFTIDVSSSIGISRDRESEANCEPLRITFARLFSAGVIKASARDRAQSWDWGATSELRASRSARCPFLLHCSLCSLLFVFNSPQQRADPFFLFFILSCVSSFATFPLL